MSSNHRTEITGVILAGGRGRRMGGVDKGLVELRGQPLVEHVLAALRPQVERVLINANRNRVRYEELGCQVISDSIEGYQGALAGIVSAMREATTPYILTVPCDGPLLPTDLAERLYRSLERSKTDICAVHDGTRLQPVFALLRRSLLPDLLDYLQAGERKIDQWYEQCGFVRADFSDTPSAFANVNTAGDKLAIESEAPPGEALRQARVPILGFSAFSGSGKTTLLCKLIPLLRERGLRVAMVKHAHHTFDIDRPGKDSYELRKAGAEQMLVASSRRWALMVEAPHEDIPRLDTLVSRIDQDKVDLILVEGFKHERFPKIEIHRPSLGHPLLFPDDDSVVAVAADAPLPVSASPPIIDLNDPRTIADFICREFLETAFDHEP